MINFIHFFTLNPEDSIWGKLDEGFLSRRFRNFARMAPDVLDVIVATLRNSLAGLGVAVKKIAEKAKEETKQA